MEALQDTDVIGYDEKYDKRLKEVRQNISKGFRDREAQAEFLRRFDVELTNQQFKIKQYGYKKLIDQRQNTLFNEEIPEYVNNYLKETNPDIKGTYLSQIAAAFKRATDDGVISQKDAGENFIKLKAELPEKQAKWDIQNNLDYAVGELQRGQYGVYKDLPFEKKTELLKDALNQKEIRLKKEKLVAVEALNEEEDALIQLNMQGTLTKDVIEEKLRAGKIRPEFAQAEINNLDSIKRIGAKGNSAAFNKLVDDILANKAKNKIRIALLQENAKGEITGDELNLLYTFNENITKQTIAGKLPRTAWRDFLNVINLWGDNYVSLRSEIKAQMFKQYIRLTNEGDNPQEAVDKVIRGQIQKDITETTTKFTTKNIRIQDKIKELKKTMSDDKIKEALKEKGINPEIYDF